MNYATYKKIRSYCWEDLSPYIDNQVSNNTLEWLRDLTGVTADINHEYSAAMGLFQTNDLTPREQSAAQLLAAVSNHRRYTWWRDPITPDGSPPVEPLEPWQAAELWTQTRQAVEEYAAFIPEREAATLLALIEAAPAPDTATPGLLVTETVEQRRARYLAIYEEEEKRNKRGAYQRAAERLGVDRSNMQKDIDKARATRDTQKKAGTWTSQLVQDGKRRV